MDGPVEESTHDENPLLNAKDDEINNEFTDEKHTDLSFPWPLINTIENLYVFIKSNLKHTGGFKRSFGFRILMLIICIICIIHGTTTLRYCYDQRMLSIYFIVQGACGLFVTLIHIGTIVFE